MGTGTEGMPGRWHAPTAWGQPWPGHGAGASGAWGSPGSTDPSPRLSPTGPSCPRERGNEGNGLRGICDPKAFSCNLSLLFPGSAFTFPRPNPASLEPSRIKAWRTVSWHWGGLGMPGDTTLSPWEGAGHRQGRGAPRTPWRTDGGSVARSRNAGGAAGLEPAAAVGGRALPQPHRPPPSPSPAASWDGERLQRRHSPSLPTRTLLPHHHEPETSLLPTPAVAPGAKGPSCGGIVISEPAQRHAQSTGFACTWLRG